jgi:hypothetical protein
MEGLKEILSQLNLNPALYGLAVVLAILLRYLRGMVSGIGNPQTYFAAVLLGALGAILEMTQGDSWREVVKTGLSLAAVVLLMQRALQAAAEKVAWLPQDNEWVKGG